MHEGETTMTRTKARAQIEQSIGTTIVRGWHLDGAGPARFGWAAVHPCRVRYLGRTLAEAAALGAR